METSEIFEKNYQQYCDQLAKVDFDSVKNILDIDCNADGKKVISFFNRKYFVSDDGITDADGNRANYSASVIIAQYILLCPDELHLSREWASFKDFKRKSYANVDHFSSESEKVIKKHFTGKVADLGKACKAFGGYHHNLDVPYDLAIRFDILPRISMLLLYSDSDDEFPAQCKMLFQKHTEFYIDPESLAIALAYLVNNLKKQL
jgi:hypothetical protein